MSKVLTKDKELERLSLIYPELKSIRLKKNQIKEDYTYKELKGGELNMEEIKNNNEIINENIINNNSKSIQNSSEDINEPLLPKEDINVDNKLMIKEDLPKNFDEIPFPTILCYSLPSFGKMSCLVLLNINSTLYYESLGASLIYMSFFVTLTRCIEIIIKPLIAHMSDETISKFGRRKPYMLAGCGFYALFLILIFSPPSFQTDVIHLNLWFGIFFVLFFVAESFTIAPYLALGPELSENSKQREKLYFYFYIFQYIGVLFSASAPLMLTKLFNKCDCTYCDNLPLTKDIEKCRRDCLILCNVRANEKSLGLLTSLIGIIFVISIILLSLQVKEKCGSFSKEKMAFVPSLRQLVNNKPFVTLIIPWICDISIMTIFSTMLPFFLNIVINPQRYCINNGIPLNRIECSVNFHLGIIISIFFVCCIIACSFWHFLVNKLGKRKCWQLYSLFCVIPFTLFMFCDEGSTSFLTFCAVLTSLPTGGAYINDALISDTISYDEFFTGKRNEGIFTIFSAFIPKFVSLFAQAIPLSMLSLIGFRSSENGYVHVQPKAVINFIKIIFSIVPILLSVTSYYFKLKYPIEDDSTNYQIKKSTDIQKENYNEMKEEKLDFYLISDPVYNRKHINLIIEGDTLSKTKNLCDHFNNMPDLIKLYKNDIKPISNKIYGVLIVCGVALFVSFLGLLLTLEFLSNQGLSFIPISLLFLITFCIVTIGIYFLKLRVIKEVIMEEYKPDPRFLRLYIYTKIKNEKNSQFKDSFYRKII